MANTSSHGAVTPLTRARTRKRKTPPPLPLPWRCVVLGVDTATRSGWAVRTAGKLVRSGEVSTEDDDEMEWIARTTVATALLQHLIPVLVLERPWGGNDAMLIGLGAARGAWLRAWRRAQQPKSRVVRVYPASWRARVLGGGAHALARDVVRPIEMQAALHECCTCNASHMQTVRVSCRGCIELGPDEAAAILISKWAAHAEPVGKVLPERVRALTQRRA